MDMKARTLYLAVAATAVLLAGCKKGAFMEGSAPVYGEGAPLQFKVAIDGFSTRSHFENDGQGSVGDLMNLVWDEDDAIGVIAVPYDEAAGKYRIDLVADEAHVCIAVFRGYDDNLTWWMAKGDGEGEDFTTDSSLYGFFAYYPAKQGEKHPFKLFGEDIDVGFIDDYHMDKVYSPQFYVSNAQDGVNFNEHHILYDLSHLPMLDIDEKKATAFKTAADLKAGTVVNFTNFEPVTTMLRFCLVGDDDQTREIASVRATIGRYRTYDKDSYSYYLRYGDDLVWKYLEYNFCNYYAPFFGIAGDGISPTAFHSGFQERVRSYMEGDTKGDDYEDEPSWLEENYQHLMATGLVTAESDMMPPFTGFYPEGIHTSNSVTVWFNEHLWVSNSPTDYYYMVIYPTFLQAFESGIDGFVRFEAMDPNGNVVLSGEKPLPENGLIAGHRYNCTLSLTDGLTFSSTSAGGYTIVGTNPVPVE